MNTTKEQNDGASKARRVHVEIVETPADTDDLWSTAGKNGRPPLPAQPDPSPDSDAGDAASFALAPTEPSGRKPGRPRGSRTRKPAANSDLTAIVYATKDRSECGGHVIDRQGGPDGKADLVVNNGMALISIPTSQEGKTWIYLHVAEERRTRGLPLNLTPATIRILHPIDGRPTGDPMDPPLTAGQIAKMEADTAAERAEPSRKPGRPRGSRTRKPADNVDPRVDPAPSLPGDLLWLALESFAGDIKTEIVHRNPENVRHAASLILRLLSIAGA